MWAAKTTTRFPIKTIYYVFYYIINALIRLPQIVHSSILVDTIES